MGKHRGSTHCNVGWCSPVLGVAAIGLPASREARVWDALHAHYDMRRINHSVAFRSGLIAKRAELAGQIETMQREMRDLVAAIGHVDASIRLFDPNADLED